MSRSVPKTDDLSFEDAMQRLDEIVGDMEMDRMPLETMLTSYEEGIALLKHCRERLESARRRVELITADIEAGKASTTPFDPAAAAATSAPAGTDNEDAGTAAVRQSPPRRRKGSEGEEIRLF